LKAVKDFISPPQREITRDEYEEALQTSKQFKALLEDPAFKSLVKIINKQMEHRVGTVLTAPRNHEDELEHQLIRGERLGLALILRTVPAIIEDAEATLEQWRKQPNGPESEPEPKSDAERGPANLDDFRRSP
jgi:hypothetical protein